MTSRRVVVTGIGTITPLGENTQELWDALLSGENGIDRITHFDPSSFASQIAGEVKNFDPTRRLSPKEIKRTDRYSQYAIYATAEALDDSRLLEWDKINKEKVGIYIASGIGGILTLEEEKEKLMREGPRRISPFFVPMMIANIASGLVSIKYGFKGPNFSIVSACSSSAHAIGEAYNTIKRGDADIMIAGGAEAPITPLSIAGFSSMKALSTRNTEPERASRPFDRERDGFVVGEGAGILVLEELSCAEKRGAKIYAEISGYYANADAYHITAPAPEGEGAYNVMKETLSNAGVSPREVGYINAHGTSTELNDKLETLAIKRLFGEYAYKLAISSTKSMIGHLLGAAGGVETAVTVLSVYHQKIHPTRNLENPDPECDLDYVREGARDITIDYAISNSFGFGGHNACVLIKKFEQ